MIEFGPANLRVPHWTRPVYMVAAGTTDFRKRYPEKKLEELCMMAFRMLLEENDLKLDPLEVKRHINFAAYGEFADHFQDQLLCEAKVHDYLGLDLLPNVGVKTGGATGGSAMLVGANTIASGYSDCTLVLGWERMDEVKTWTGNYYIATAACKDFETRLARNYASYYAPMARRFQEMYGVDERLRAEIAVKNRGYACSSPFAQQPGRHTIEEVLEGEIVSDPLRFLECCAMSVGSAAALLCSEELAYRLTDEPVRLFIAGGSHTLRTGDRRPMPIPLLAHETEEGYRWLYEEMRKQDGRWPGFESFGATRFAAYMVYRMAGIQVPIEALDLVETSRPTATWASPSTARSRSTCARATATSRTRTPARRVAAPPTSRGACWARCTRSAPRGSSSAVKCCGSSRASTTSSTATPGCGVATARPGRRPGKASR
jgi:acetyl-CoA C-acetyltransferase